MVVLAMLSVLAMLVMPLGEAVIQAQQERELKQSLWEIRSAIDEYKKAYDAGAIDKSSSQFGYPANLQVLVNGITDIRAQSNGATLYFLRRIPRDPFAPADLVPEQTWRLRSYASSADNPKPGSDVYDIYPWSKDGVALDGTRYAQW